MSPPPPNLLIVDDDPEHRRFLQGERVEALDAGADAYLTKPFSIEELLARVRGGLCAQGRGRGELIRAAPEPQAAAIVDPP